jgi:peptidoglycan/LPS O-acetylase OafA/YrhL
MASVTHRTDYRPDVDGLRALAVLPVLLFHAKLGCPGGFVGVDIFFVISGFLISSLILKDLGNGTFSLITFWERRIRRILPALTVVVFVSLIAGWFLYLPEDFESVGKSVAAQATLISNVFFYLQRASYFDAGLTTQPLLHTWSLAVEEQFYLLFPLLLIFLARYRKLLFLPQTLVCLAAGSFALSATGSYSHPVATFYLLPTRAWELLTGALLAIMRGQISANSPTRETAGLLGISLVFFSICFYDGDTRFPGLAAIPPCLGAALIIFSSEAKLSVVGRILAIRPIVFIGLISYSLYLWHWPLLVFSKYLARGTQSVGLRVTLLLASAALAFLSWRYVETPFRMRRILNQRPQIFRFAGLSSGTLLLIGILVYHCHGFPSRVPSKVLSYFNSRNHRAFMHDISLEQAVAGRFDEFGSRATNQPISVLIWGDSHAMAVTPVLDDLCRRFSQRGIQATYSATAPVLGYVSKGRYALNENSPVFAKAVVTFVAQKQVKNVILAAHWAVYPVSGLFKTQLLSTVRTLMDLGVKVYVLKDVPNPGFDVPRVTAVTAMHHSDLEQLGVTRNSYKTENEELRQTFEQISQMGATVLDPSDYFLNPKGLYGVVISDQVLYTDGHHLTVEGSRLLFPLFEPIFQTK